MKSILIPLHQLPLGKSAKIKQLCTDNITKRRLFDLGLIQDTLIEALQKSPSGDPTAYHVRGAVIALRSEEASKIFVEAIEPPNEKHSFSY